MRPYLTLLCCGLLLRAGAATEISCDESKGRLEITHRGKPLLVYSFGKEQFKPYVKELRTLSGANLLLDAPADHLHHHGLMFAIRINGTNFWEEAKDAGRQEHIEMKGVRAEATFARFQERLHWRSSESATPILTEDRELILTVDEKADEVALRWRGRFTVGSAPVKLHGSAYNGLGLRLPPGWDHTAVHRNSENAPYTKEQKWDVTAARWAAVSQKESGTVILFGTPSNAGETRFFSMLNPFTYLSVTQNLELQPIEHAPGEKFELDYLVLVSASEKSSEEIRERHARWQNEILK